MHDRAFHVDNTVGRLKLGYRLQVRVKSEIQFVLTPTSTLQPLNFFSEPVETTRHSPKF